MKVILSGYTGSKSILKASSFLLGQYLTGLDIYWLNYGEPVEVYTGTYIEMADKQLHVKSWAGDLRTYLSALSDELIIFALDDYLLSEELNWNRYLCLLHLLDSAHIVCARLCISDFYKPSEIEKVIVSGPLGSIIQLNNTADYSVTTQYCIWKRTCLIDVLEQVETPWEFEILGSQYLNASGRKVIGFCTEPPMQYNCSSSLSTRWAGINVSGCKLSDIEYLIAVGDLNRNELTNRGNTVHWGDPYAIAEAV